MKNAIKDISDIEKVEVIESDTYTSDAILMLKMLYRAGAKLNAEDASDIANVIICKWLLSEARRIGFVKVRDGVELYSKNVDFGGKAPFGLKASDADLGIRNYEELIDALI